MKKLLLITIISFVFASCEDNNVKEPTNDNTIEQPEGDNNGNNDSPIDKTQIISFQDPNTKVICTLYWDINKDGELSYDEASAVTDLQTVFKDSSIIAFDELKHFTGLTTIADNAFKNCQGLKVITIPISATSIGKETFYGCKSLTSLTFPESITTINTGAFIGCQSLTSIIIPDSITTIEDSVFSGCRSLTSVTIPNSVTAIGGSAFYGCSSLTSVTIPDSVTTIGEYAFSYCSSLTSVTIPDSVTTIGDWAFSGCSSLTSVTIPDSVTTIGNYAFEYCSSLTSVTIPDSVTTMGDGAFYECSSLTSVTIPDSVTTIGNYAFEYCSSLTSVTIPDSVTTIGDGAFYECSSLTSVTIGDSVTTIGSSAFSECSSLSSIYCKATTPPIGSYNMFDGNAPDRIIYVPTESIRRYQEAQYWEQYANYIKGKNGDSENEDEYQPIGNITITADNRAVSIGETVTFTVIDESGNDVTPYSTVYSKTNNYQAVPNPYTIDTVGVIELYATCGTTISDITAIESFNNIRPLPVDDQPSNTTFNHRILVVGHVGTSEGWTPSMMQALKVVSQNCGYMYYEAMAYSWASRDKTYSDAARVISDYYNITGYPTTSYNITYPYTSLYSAKEISNHISYLWSSNGSGAGIAASVTGGDSMVVVNAEIKANVTNDYRITAWLLEDNIYDAQSGATEEWMYYHDNVIRNIATSNPISGFDLGNIKAGETATNKIILDIKSQQWITDNMKVLLIVTAPDSNNNYEVVNVTVCPINSDVKYDYK